LCLLLGCGVGAVRDRAGARAAWIVLLVAVTLASARTVVRNRDWRDGLTLFSSAAVTSPRSVKVQNNLGAELLRRGRHGEARARCGSAPPGEAARPALSPATGGTSGPPERRLRRSDPRWLLRCVARHHTRAGSGLRRWRGPRGRGRRLRHGLRDALQPGNGARDAGIAGRRRVPADPYCHLAGSWTGTSTLVESRAVPATALAFRVLLAVVLARTGSAFAPTRRTVAPR